MDPRASFRLLTVSLIASRILEVIKFLPSNILTKFQVNIGDRTIADDENVSSLVKQFCDKKITFCSGFDDETKVEKAPIEQIFVELVNGKIVSRGRTCKFKVDLPNSKVIFQ
jgi:hypothetical protein